MEKGRLVGEQDKKSGYQDNRAGGIARLRWITQAMSCFLF